MALFVRLSLSLAILLAGFPMLGTSVSGGCSVSLNAKESPCCASAEDGCCCERTSNESQKASCCHQEETSSSPEQQNSSKQSSSDHVTAHSNCGGEHCPCSTYGCCGQVSAALLFVLMPQGFTEILPTSEVAEGHCLFSSRSDRPLVPPPKVQLAI